MSFFDTEEAHAVMHDKVADEGSVDFMSSEPGSSPPEVDKGEDNPLQHLPSLVE